MNVIVSNKYAAMLSNLNIDLIKSINGEFDVQDLIAQFDNFFFNKMILDITAIKDYQDITQIQKLSFGMDVSKIILVLDDSPVVNSRQYLSELVSMGIYNFTRNIDAVSYLIDNPNSYKDVAQFHILGGGEYDNNSTDGGGSKRNSDNEKTYINNSIGMPSLGGTRIIGFKDLTDHAGASSVLGDGTSLVKIEHVDHVTLYPWIPYYIRGVVRDEINLRRLGTMVNEGDADYLLEISMPGFRIRSSVSDRENNTLINVSDIKLEFFVRNGKTGTLVWQSGIISYQDWHEDIDEDNIIRDGLKETIRRALDRMQQKF